MKLLSTLSNYLTRAAKPSAWDDYWYSPVAIPSITGVNVDESEALKYVTVWACVRLISETIASLPLHVYRKMKDGGKEKATDHPLYELLHHKPNPEMTAFQWREVGLGHLLLWGNWYSQIEENRKGDPIALWPLNPASMKVERRGEDGPLQYRYKLTGKGEERVFNEEEILHIPGLGFNGVIGYSPITLAREAIGIGRAAEELAARFFANDATPGGYLEHPGKLSPQGHENLRKNLTETHGGLKNKWKPGILEEGMKFHQLEMPLRDAQFLETRKFQRSEICSFFRVPPHLIADVELSTSWGTGIEQQSIGFVVYTLRPWLVRIEQALLAKLFKGNKRIDYFAEHSVDGLLRGDSQARSNYYKQMFEIGVLSINDILALENMNPIGEDGDRRFIPANNLAPLDKIDEVLAKKNAPPPAPVTESEDQESEEKKEKKRKRVKEEERAITLEEEKKIQGEIDKKRVELESEYEKRKQEIEAEAEKNKQEAEAESKRIALETEQKLAEEKQAIEVEAENRKREDEERRAKEIESQKEQLVIEMREKAEAERQADRQKVGESFRNLFIDASGKLVRRESIALKRAYKKQDYEKYSENLQEYYKKLPEFMTNTFNPILNSYNSAFDSTGSVNLDEWMTSYIDESRKRVEAWETSFITRDAWSVNSTGMDEAIDLWADSNAPMIANRFLST